MTKSEKAAWAEKRAVAHRKAEEMTMAASLAAEAHSRLDETRGTDGETRGTRPGGRTERNLHNFGSEFQS
jgi:hypothetical protein